MKEMACLTLAVLLAGVLGGCSVSTTETTTRPDGQYANYVPADHGYYSRRAYRSQSDYYRNYNGIDGP
jgi:hypothetical protein